MNEVLALGYVYRTEIQGIAPVVRHLKESKVNCHFLTIEKLRGLAEKEGVSVDYLGEKVGKDQKVELLQKFGEILEAFYLNISKDRDFIPAHLTIPWMKRQVSPRKLLEIINYYFHAKELIAERSPQRILLCNSWSMYGFVSLVAAKESDIETIEVPTHFTQLSAMSEDLLRACSSSLPKRWGVMGTHLRDILLKLNIENSSIELTNLPMFDVSSPTPKADSQSELLESKLAKTGCEDFILLTLQDYPEDESIIEDLIRALECTPSLALVVRLHPFMFSQVGILKRLKLKFMKRVFIEREVGLSVLIDRCKILVSLNSLTLYEAILGDKPVISLTYYSRLTSFLFVDSEAVILVHSPHDISKAINSILNDRETQKILKRGRDHLIDTFTPKSERSSVELLGDLIGGIKN